MEILAKKLETNEKVKYQSLQEHTLCVVDEAFKLIEGESLKQVSSQVGWSEEKIKDLIFFGAYFHDLGKGTKEFQETITKGASSTHALYSAYLLTDIEDFEFIEKDDYINMLLLIVITHHSQFYNGLYAQKSYYDCHFFNEIESFFNCYSKEYEKRFGKECKYDFDFSICSNEELIDEIEQTKMSIQGFKQYHSFRMLYAYVLGILNLADWLASARFSQTLPKIHFDYSLDKSIFFEILGFDSLIQFQKKLSETNGSCLVEIPTGEGKTEGSLLWSIYNLRNDYSKIIYTLPTQTTSNKLYERVEKIFGNSYCGLVHSSAKFYLEEVYEKDNGKIDEKFHSNFLLQKTFNKPVTVGTIDSLLKYFVNIGRFSITTVNVLNSTIIIDEVHAYDLKLMGFMKKFFELCEAWNVQVCLMSASIPTRIKELLGVQHYPLITQQALFDKKANEIIKKECFLEDDYGFILETFEEKKNIIIIRNTVKNATKTYKKLLDLGIEKEEIVLYHSTFKKKDRLAKEDLIYQKLKFPKPFILIATQVVEISLDIDFDVMFTDNAPIDALIQRFGRVNRKKSLERKGKIFIYQNQISNPYDKTLLDLTYETLENGYFSISKYVEWLNIVYDKLFDEDITMQNTIYRLFDDGYKKFDKTIKQLQGITKSNVPYNLRDIELAKNDYLLYDDYINGNMGYEETISLPFYLEKENLYKTNEDIFYKVLKLDYSYEKGILLKKESSFSIV